MDQLVTQFYLVVCNRFLPVPPFWA